MSKEQIFLIDNVLAQLIRLIMTKQGKPFQESLDLLYNSQLYDALADVETGLYLQSACYNYELLEHECKYGSLV